MSKYLSYAFASWLTPIYLIILAVITVAVIQNILKEKSYYRRLWGSNSYSFGAETSVD